jgi:hypothetical protein
VKPNAWRNQISSASGCISRSMNTPVGSPAASFTISSEGTGETVSRVMPPRRSASVLAQATSGRLCRQKPQIERMNTG